jgi:hypothetical protein
MSQGLAWIYDFDENTRTWTVNERLSRTATPEEKAVHLAAAYWIAAHLLSMEGDRWGASNCRQAAIKLTRDDTAKRIGELRDAGVDLLEEMLAP